MIVIRIRSDNLLVFAIWSNIRARDVRFEGCLVRRSAGARHDEKRRKVLSTVISACIADANCRQHAVGPWRTIATVASVEIRRHGSPPSRG